MCFVMPLPFAECVRSVIPKGKDQHDINKQPHNFFLIIGGSRDTIELRLGCRRDQGARYQCSFRKGKGWGKNIAHPLFLIIMGPRMVRYMLMCNGGQGAR